MSDSDAGSQQDESPPIGPTASWYGRQEQSPRRAIPPTPPQFPDIDVVGLLGAGGMGVVYLARDRPRDTIVALKTLLHYGAADLYRFKQEFRALADLTHPNLVALYQLLSTGEHWCFTMEFVEGQHFLDAIRPGPANDAPTAVAEPATLATVPALDNGEHYTGFDENRLRETLRQLAEGLYFLHSRGKLHCDLKPSNVLIDREGRVVILDFGLVQESTDQPETEVIDLNGIDPETMRPAHDMTWTQGGVIRGTIVYMSPEQAAGQPLSPASDWYAVGVMLYQALTGRLPFKGGVEVLQRKQKEDPRPPSTFRDDLPADLEGLCIDLLQRDPARRPDGRQVLARLGRTLEPEPAARLAMSGALPFVGRNTQLDLLRQAWKDVKHGQAQLILVPGPSGAGKSTLIQRFLSEASVTTDALILHGRCFEQESVPFKAVDALMDHLSHTLKNMPTDEAAALLPPGITALSQMFPVLKRAPAVATAGLMSGPTLQGLDLRRQGFAALRELLFRLSKRSPLALWVDDLQWGDLDSAELLASLLHGTPPPILFLLSYRGEYAHSSVCLRTLFWLLDDSASMGRQEMPVEPLTVEEAVELARQLLGPASMDERAERIARESGGNPYFVQELVRYAEASDSFGGGGTTQAVELDEVVWSRVQRLPEPARALLEVLAVAGQPLQQNIACQAAELRGDERRALGQLRSENLVRGTGPRPEDEVEAFHDRIRESVRAHLSSAVLQRHHEQLALALESVPGTDPERLAVHFAAAGQRSRAGSYFARAGEAAAAALAFDLAAAHFRHALLQGTADEDAACRLRRQLGDALANAGRGTEAAEAYLAAARGAHDREALQLRGRAGSQLLFAGKTDEGLEILNEVLAAAGMGPRKSILGTVLSLRWNQFRLWLRGLKFDECTDADLREDARVRLDSAWSAAIGLSIVDPVRGYELHTRSLLLALKLGEPTRIARAVAMVAGHTSAEGSSKKAYVLRLLERADELARKTGQPYAHAVSLHDRGCAHFLFAEFRQGQEKCDEAEIAYHRNCTGVAWEIDTMRTFAMWSLGYLGEVVELRRRQEKLMKDARERNARYALTNFQTYVNLFAPLADDNPEQAIEYLLEARQGWTPRGFYVQTHAMDGGQILLDFYLDRPQAVWDLVRSKWWSYHFSILMQIQIIRTFLRYSRGAAALALSAQTASPESWLKQAERDGRRLEREGTSWAAALGRVLRAGAAFRRGQSETAVPLLEQAVELFDTISTRLYSAGARFRLGKLVGGDRGKLLLEQAAEIMKAQEVRNVERIIATVTPGFPA
jgi:serine/threonine protein kinase